VSVDKYRELTRNYFIGIIHERRKEVFEVLEELDIRWQHLELDADEKIVAKLSNQISELDEYDTALRTIIQFESKRDKLY